MDGIEMILSRRSAVKLVEPAPPPEVLRIALAAAANAPDHGKMQPWKFIVIDTPVRERFADELAACLQRAQPAVAEDQLARERAKAFRAPMIIVVAARVQPDRKGVPVVEQLSSAAAAAQNAWLAFHASGYACMWKTGDAAYDPGMKRALGLQEQDQIIAFLYVGRSEMPGNAPPPRKPDLVVHWQG